MLALLLFVVAVEGDVKPRMVSPAVGNAQLSTDVSRPPGRPPVPAELEGHAVSIWGLYRICVDATGAVTSAGVVRSAHPAADPLWLETIKTWSYRPYVVEGQAVPFCYVNRLQHGDRENAPPTAVMVSPVVGSGQLAIDVNAAQYKPRMPRELNRAGNTIWGLYKICVEATGTVKSVSVVRSAHELADGPWMEKIRTWKYRPYTVDGKPTPFCYTLRLQVSAQLDGAASSPQASMVQLLTDVSKPPHKLGLPAAYNQPGTKVSGVYKICVSRSGEVDTVEALTPPPPEVNELWSRTIKTWRYRPYMHQGAWRAYCFSTRLQVAGQP